MILIGAAVNGTVYFNICVYFFLNHKNNQKNGHLLLQPIHIIELIERSTQITGPENKNINNLVNIKII